MFLIKRMWLQFIFSHLVQTKCRWSILDVVLLEDIDNSYIILLLIASPYFRAQKPITYLNISVMVFCVKRNGWFSFSHTQFSSHHYGTPHAASSGIRILSLAHRSSLSLLYMYIIFSIKLYIACPNFIASAAGCCCWLLLALLLLRVWFFLGTVVSKKW